MVVLSVPEYILKISVALLSLVFVALVVTRNATRRRVLAGAAACAASGATMVLMTMGLYTSLAGRYFGPDPSVIIFVSAVTGSIGGLVSWGLVGWWPNKSLGRTREG
jgi:hypothetical protein